MTDWKDKIVVVTGGSEGLGRELCLTFARFGATVVALARKQPPLIALSEAANSEGRVIDWLVADVTDDLSTRAAVQEIIKRHGRVDVWINNVGKSTRTSLMDCGVACHEDLMQVNFYSVVRCSLAVLPHLESTSGHLVNIGSLSCKTAWRNVAPYTTSKHAMAGFHHQLRLEGPANVHYLLVCPGPIQRPDAGSRYNQQSSGLPESAAEPGAGVKLKGIPPAKLAARIELYCRKRKLELVMPSKARLLFVISQWSPRLGDWMLRRFNKSQ